MMILNVSNVKYQFFGKMDFDDIISLRDSMSKSLQQFIFQQLISASNDKWSFTLLSSNIFISWRAWCVTLGIEKLTQYTLALLEKLSVSIMKTNTKYFFMGFAYVLSIACENDTDALMSILLTIKESLEEENDFPKDAHFVASFCSGIVLANHKDWEKRLDIIFEMCAGNESEEQSQARLTFAYTFLKLILFFPILQDRIPLKLFHVFIDKADWKSVIDFFIIKSTTRQ